MGLVHAYLWEGNRTEADQIAALVGQGAGSEDSELMLAQKELDAGHFEESLRRFKPISEGKTWVAPLATIWIGVVEKRMGDTELSRQTVRRGIDQYHKTGQPATDGLLTVGTAAFRRGDFADAAEWYGLAHQESPREAKAAFHFGRALEESGNPSRAMEIYKQITSGDLALLPDSQFTLEDVYLQMAVAAQKLGQPQVAIQYFEEVLRRSPNHPKREAIRAQIEVLRTAHAPTR
jgi:tetratricopeptide (TPR) repeat protein